MQAWISFAVPFLALAYLTGPELPTLGGSLIGIVVFLALERSRVTSPEVNWRSLLPHLAAYILIVALVAITRLVPDLRTSLATAVLSWSVHDHFSGTFAPLFHPGTIVFASLLLAALATRNLSVLGPALRATLQRAVPVAVALLIMLTLSRTMVQAGLIDTLAHSAARTGPVWPRLAAVVGTAGTFVSGSATASNVLFTQFQISTADALHLSPAIMASAQAAGAAIGNIVAPHNIIAGCATVGLVGREGDIMQRTIPVCACVLLVIGVLLPLGT